MSKEESANQTPVAKQASTVPPPAKPPAAAASTATAAPKAGPSKPPAPPTKGKVPRRSFLSWMTLAWAAFTASMLATATATGRFMFPNVLFEPPPTFKAGFPDEIQVGQVDERFKQKFAVWLRSEEH